MTSPEAPDLSCWSGTKRISHPVVGEMTLAFENLAVPSARGIIVATYLAEPGSPSADALDLLRSWSAPALETALITDPDADR